jgi:hypothetical protein
VPASTPAARNRLRSGLPCGGRRFVPYSDAHATPGSDKHFFIALARL